MRPLRRKRRALAEIVGTLMLVVIVVAAATAFSFFVTAEEKITLANEAANDAKKLESLKVVSLDAAPPEVRVGLVNYSRAYPDNSTADECATKGADCLGIELTSLDVNFMTIDGITINGLAVTEFNIAWPNGTSKFIWSNGNSTTTLASGASPTTAYERPPGGPTPSNITTNILPCLLPYGSCFSFPLSGFSQVVLTIVDLSLDVAPLSVLTSASLIQVSVFTLLGNEFITAFVPPVAEPTISYVGEWPLLDGSGSYQPPGSSTVANASIDTWSWTVAQQAVVYLPIGGNDNGSYYGQTVELPHPFDEGGSYEVTLTVNNTFGLIGTATVDYTAPGTPTYYTVVFSESTLPSGDNFSVKFGDHLENMTTGTGTNTLTFSGVENGSYAFAVTAVSGYTADPQAGNVTVSGADQSIDVTFS